MSETECITSGFVCQTCGRSISKKPGPGRNPKYCSETCRSKQRRPAPKPRAKKDRPVAICKVCGGQYKVRRPDNKGCCSRRCTGAVGRAAQSGTYHRPKHCGQCGTKFQGLAADKFCSDGCKAKSLARECKRCGKAFNSYQQCTSFCSRECYSKSYYLPSSGEVDCAECGRRVFVEKRYSESRLYCSDSCLKKATRRTAKHKRRLRIDAGHIESVTLGYLLRRDKGVCQICRRPVDPKAVVPDPMAPTHDHVIPLAKGGTHTKLNSQLAHFSCNTRKSDHVLTLF